MYYILFGLFYLVSLLPMRVLYAIADFIFIIVYYLIGYRRKVVMRNLTEAFPEKTFAELTRIEKKFFRNMIDSMVETFKLLSASKKFLQKRVTADYQLVEHLYATGKSCQVHLGHTFNWEWGQTVLQMHTRFQVLVVYAKLSNLAFERLLLKLRTRFGSIFIPGSDMKASISKFSDTQYLLGLVADQSPGSPTTAYWLNFFNKPTAFIPGPEKGARNFDLPVIFATLRKTRRGYYHADLFIATETPGLMEEGQLTKMYVTFLENTIRRDPENWLWSHRRWKLPYKPEYQSRWIDDRPPPATKPDSGVASNEESLTR